MKNDTFFDAISGNYDSMINSENVIKMRSNVLKSFIQPEMKNAADVGCGTGNDSIALSLSGLNVTGFDNSTEMFNTAKKNSGTYNQKIKFIHSPADKINTKYFNKFDIVVSLGNTVANIPENKLDLSFKNIYNMLRINGVFVMQILNYTAIKKENKRIINITEDKKNTYVRFYDFEKTNLVFNILSIYKSDNKKYTLLGTTLYPYDRNYLKAKLQKAGFNNLKFYSDFIKGKFNSIKSKDLVIEAVKK